MNSKYRWKTPVKPGAGVPWLRDETVEEMSLRRLLHPEDVIRNPWVPGVVDLATVYRVCYGRSVCRADVYRWPSPAGLRVLRGEALRQAILGFFEEAWYAEYEEKRKPFIPTSTAASGTVFHECAVSCSSTSAGLSFVSRA